jgi:nitrite reductase/ring-hydroxylating ferredoxin subunit
MDRKDFLKTCGYACLSGIAISTLFTSCNTVSNLDAEPKNSIISIDEKEFQIVKKGVTSFRDYVLIHTSSLPFPICLRKNENTYSAMLLKCTHQGAELQVFGERMVCPAHGSEFNLDGEVVEGPAVDALQTFPTETKNGQILITIL